MEDVLFLFKQGDIQVLNLPGYSKIRSDKIKGHVLKKLDNDRLIFLVQPTSFTVGATARGKPAGPRHSSTALAALRASPTAETKNGWHHPGAGFLFPTLLGLHQGLY